MASHDVLVTHVDERTLIIYCEKAQYFKFDTKIN